MCRVLALTCARDVLSRLDVLVLADGQAQDLGRVVLDEREGVGNVGGGRHFGWN